MRRIGLLILLCALLVPGAAAASANGSLTSAEYAQLIAVRKEVKSVKAKTVAATVKAVVWDCETIQEVTPLLGAMRSDCIAQAEMADFPAVVHALVKECSVYKTLGDRFKCMTPTYSRLYAINLSFYRSESLIHLIATSRHFTAACANYLSEPPKVLAEEKQTTTAFRSILAAMKAANALATQKYAGELVTESAEVQQGQNANAKGHLSLCPHQ